MKEQEKALQYDIALRAVYDGLFELNVTRNTYRTIYRVPEKYVTPVESGILSDAVGKMARETVHPEDAGRFLAFFALDSLQERLRAGNGVTGEFRKLCADGGYQWKSLLVLPLKGMGDDILLCYVQDVDERKRTQDREKQNAVLRQQKLDAQRYRIIVERTGTIVLEWNTQPETVYCSPGAAQFAFINRVRRSFARLYVSHRDVHPEDWPAVRAAVQRLFSGADDVEVTARLLRLDGGYLWCKCTATAVRRRDGKLSRLIATVNDIDAFVKAQQALAYRAEYDQLTGYGNFDKFKRQVRELLKRRDGKRCSIWYSDLKNFKYINDIYGYDAGDRLLRHWADLIARESGEGETFARINADNFALFRRYEERGQLETRFEAMVSHLRRFEQMKSKEFPVEIVSGIYCIEQDSQVLSVEDMIDRANMAQKSVKPQPGSRIAFYTEEMRSQVIREKAMEADMSRAIKAGEFCVYLQGQVDIQHGNRISGAEALVRWNRPGQGLVPPSEFIPLFEKNGFIVELDRFVFEEVCRYLAGRIRRQEPLFKISVNASRLTLLQPDFLAFYTGVKRSYNIPDALLELECTETVLIENLLEIGQAAAQLRQNGFLLGMDDFGSGYSSLNVLKDVIVDILKLDMAFFQNGLTKERDRAIVSSIVTMAGALDMRVVAEGVETVEQVAFLRRIGCDTVQGYVFFRPVPMEEFRADVVFDTCEERQSLPDAAGGVRGDAEMRALFLQANGVPGAIVRTKRDAALTITLVTDDFEALTGYRRQELRERFQNQLVRLLLPEDAARLPEAVWEIAAADQSAHLEFRLRRKDGSPRWISATCFLRLDSGEAAIDGVMVDITAVKELESAARQNASRLQMLLDNMLDGVCIFELREKLRPIYMNQRYYDMFEYSRTEYWQDRAENIMANIWEEDAREIMRLLRQAALTRDAVDYEYRLNMRSGAVAHIRLWAMALPGKDDGIPVFLTMLTDMTALREMERQLEQVRERQQVQLLREKRGRKAAEERAMRDQMTGLYNKVSGEAESRRRLAEGGFQDFSLVLVDLDNFKQINDTYGHTFGDEVLRKAAELLRMAFPPEAVLTRFGGDEFLALLAGQDPEDPARRYQDALCGWDNGKCGVRCSIGIARMAGGDYGRLFRAADDAMYRAKQAGKNRCVLWPGKPAAFL